MLNETVIFSSIFFVYQWLFEVFYVSVPFVVVSVECSGSFDLVQTTSEISTKTQDNWIIEWDINAEVSSTELFPSRILTDQTTCQGKKNKKSIFTRNESKYSSMSLAVRFFLCHTSDGRIVQAITSTTFSVYHQSYWRWLKISPSSIYVEWEQRKRKNARKTFDSMLVFVCILFGSRTLDGHYRCDDDMRKKKNRTYNQATNKHQTNFE